MKRSIVLLLLASGGLAAQVQPFHFGNRANNSTHPYPTDDEAIHALQKLSSIPSIQFNEDESPESNFDLQVYTRLYMMADTTRNKLVNNYLAQKSELLMDFEDSDKGAEAVNALRHQLLDLETEHLRKLDQLDRIDAIAEEFRYRHIACGKLAWLPASKTTHTELFYLGQRLGDPHRFLKTAWMSYNPATEQYSVGFEPYATYAGSLRISVGTALSTMDRNLDQNQTFKSDEPIGPQQDAIQRLVGGGANVTGQVSYPLATYCAQHGKVNARLEGIARFGLDMPVIGAGRQEVGLMHEAALGTTFFYTDIVPGVSFFVSDRLGVLGGNMAFYNNLGKDDADAFVLHQLSVGFAIHSKFRLHWNYYVGSPFVNRAFSPTLGLTIMTD